MTKDAKFELGDKVSIDREADNYTGVALNGGFVNQIEGFVVEVKEHGNRPYTVHETMDLNSHYYGLFNAGELRLVEGKDERLSAKYALQVQGKTEFFTRFDAARIRIKELAVSHSKPGSMILYTIAKSEKVELGVSIKFTK